MTVSTRNGQKGFNFSKVEKSHASTWWPFPHIVQSGLFGMKFVALNCETQNSKTFNIRPLTWDIYISTFIKFSNINQNSLAWFGLKKVVLLKNQIFLKEEKWFQWLLLRSFYSFLCHVTFPGGRRMCTFILYYLVALGQSNWTLGSARYVHWWFPGRYSFLIPLPLAITSTTPAQLLSSCSDHCNRLVVSYPRSLVFPPHSPHSSACFTHGNQRDLNLYWPC